MTTSKLNLIHVIPLTANTVREVNNPFQNRIDFPIVRGDYLVITNTTLTGACEVIVEWGEAI